MNITIKDKKLKANIGDARKMLKVYGERMSKKITLRLEALAAAENLSVFWQYNGPERCHELKGNRKGCFSMDLVHPYRLIFVATDTGNAGKAAGTVLEGKRLWETIESVCITSIEDTHG